MPGEGSTRDERWNVRWGITDDKKKCREIDVWDEENESKDRGRCGMHRKNEAQMREL
jgi:hypothetical protein